MQITNLLEYSNRTQLWQCLVVAQDRIDSTCRRTLATHSSGTFS